MLTDTAIRAAKPQAKLRKLSDSGGLQLWIDPRGYRLWRFAYRFLGKQKVLALGPYPEASLAEARRRRDAARSLLKDGKDPSKGAWNVLPSACLRTTRSRPSRKS